MLFEGINEHTLKNIHRNCIMGAPYLAYYTFERAYIFKKEFKTISSHMRNVADVSGAGDTVPAVASLYIQQQKILLLQRIANLAGGIVCEEVGTAAVKKNCRMNVQNF
jgi:hypothetical protein